MRTLSLTSIALAAGLSVGAANAQDPNIPVFPSPDDVAMMSDDEVQLEASKLNCSGTYGPFDSEEQYDAFSANRDAFSQAVESRHSEIEEQAFEDAMNALPRYLDIFKNDESIAELGLEAETLARTAIGFQIGFSMAYPQATCGFDYAFGPFAQAKNLDLDAFYEQLQSMPKDQKAEMEEQLGAMLGFDDITFEQLLVNINPDDVQALKDYAAQAENDSIITAEELIGLIPYQAAIPGENMEDYEIAPLNRVAGDVLRAIGVRASAENVYALSYQIMKASYAMQTMKELQIDMDMPFFEEESKKAPVTSQDALDAMRDSTLGGTEFKPENSSDPLGEMMLGGTAVEAQDVIGPTRENLRGFEPPAFAPD